VFVTVTTPVGTSQRGYVNAYTYFPLPTVTKVRPKHGPRAGGTEVTLTGHGFVYEATTVRFGNVAAPNVTVHSEESLTVTAPAGMRKVDITVTTPGGTSAATQVDSFQYG
jgi:IPT/TIG domain-containing protein